MSINIRKNNYLFLLSVILFWFAQYVYIPHQVNFLESTYTSASLVGLVIAAYGISQMLLRIPIGFLADFYSINKPFIFIGSLGAGLASCFRIFWPNGHGFFIANLFSGLASATWISFMVFYIVGNSHQEIVKKTSNIIMAMNIGMLSAFIFSSGLYDLLGMKGMTIASFLAGILSFICILSLGQFKTTLSPTNRSHKNLKYILSILFNKRLLFFSFITLIQQGVQMTTTMSYSNQIIKDLGASEYLVGISSVIYMSASVIFSWIAKSKYLSRINPIKPILFSLMCLVIYLVIFSVVESVSLALLLQILPGITTGLCFTYLNSEALKGVDLPRKSTATGAFQAIYAIGMTLFPIFVSSVAEQTDLQTSYLYLVVLVGISIGLLLVYEMKAFRKNRKQQNMVIIKKSI